MTSVNTLITPAQAQKFGEEIYELILDNWGNEGTGADPASGSILYPVGNQPPLPGVAGIAISPRSDFDRCVINYNVNPTKPSFDQQFPVYDNGLIQNNDQIISVDRPWFGQMNGPLQIHASPDTFYGDSYLKAGTVAPQAFGNALPLGIFAAPRLRLLLFLRGLPAQPTRRSPVIWSGRLAPSGGAGVQAEQLVAVYPVHGRRHIRVTLRGSTVGGGSTADVRIGGVVGGFFQEGGPAPVHQSVECQLMAVTSLDPAESTCVVFDLPQVQFLTVYMARTGGGSTGGAYVQIEGID